MSFALIQVEPFALLQCFPGASPPEPLLWPNGECSHAVSAGFRNEGWMLAPLVYGPDAPNEFYTLGGTTPSFDGTIVTLSRTWAAVDLADTQATLTQRLDNAAEAKRQQSLTGGAGQALVYQQKLAEALAFAGDANPVAANYQLLAASVGIEASSLAGVADLVRARAAQWKMAAARIEAARLSGKAAVAAAKTVDQAVAAYAALVWS